MMFSPPQFERTVSAISAFNSTQHFPLGPQTGSVFKLNCTASCSSYKECTIMPTSKVRSGLVPGQIPFCFIAAT